MIVHWGARAKLRPFFRYRPLPLAIYSSIPLFVFSSSGLCLSLSGDWLLFFSIFTFFFHPGHLSLLGDWFLSFSGCRSHYLATAFLPYFWDCFFLFWDGHMPLYGQHFGVSCLHQPLISLRLQKLSVCVTTTKRFVQASQYASLVTRQSDAHPLQLISREVATLLESSQAGTPKRLRILLQTKHT